MNSDVCERFFKYIKVNTESSEENSNQTPSTPGQIELAELLAIELREMGVTHTQLQENGYLYAKIEKNCGSKEAIGFIAHLDTSPSVSGKDVRGIRFRYEGGNITNAEGNIILKENSDLLEYIGEEIITTDGKTLLGADNKAGIAEIMSACDFIIKNGSSIKHPDIYIAFVPDEEIGHQLKYFDTGFFKCKRAFTIDGGKEGEIEYGCFNAYKCSITFQGRNIHPGYANGKLVSPAEILSSITNALFSLKISPNESSENEGFIHITSASATDENGEIKLIIRDFTDEGIKDKINCIDRIVEQTRLQLKEKYPDFPIVIHTNYALQYKNMEHEISKHPELLEKTKQAAIESGVKPILKRIRGGTDGAALTAKGIVCPNIFTGGHNFHSTSEWISVKSMEKTVETIINLIKLL